MDEFQIAFNNTFSLWGLTQAIGVSMVSLVLMVLVSFMLPIKRGLAILEGVFLTVALNLFLCLCVGAFLLAGA